MYKALLVDDEEHCNRTLEAQLGWMEEPLEVIGKLNSVKKAKDFLNNGQQPDFLFLDVHMPEADGFDLLDDVRLDTTDVVFVTAYDEFALKAFRHHASGYLTKPVSTDELEDLVNTLRAKRGDKVDNTHQIKVNTREGVEIISLDDLLYIEADGSYTRLVFSDSIDKVLSKNLKQISQLLPDSGFLRIHSKYMVNVKYITRLGLGAQPKVYVGKEYELPVSRSRKDEVVRQVSAI